MTTTGVILIVISALVLLFITTERQHVFDDYPEFELALLVLIIIGLVLIIVGISPIRI